MSPARVEPVRSNRETTEKYRARTQNFVCLLSSIINPRVTRTELVLQCSLKDIAHCSFNFRVLPLQELQRGLAVCLLSFVELLHREARVRRDVRQMEALDSLQVLADPMFKHSALQTTCVHQH